MVRVTLAAKLGPPDDPDGDGGPAERSQSAEAKPTAQQDRERILEKIGTTLATADQPPAEEKLPDELTLPGGITVRLDNIDEMIDAYEAVHEQKEKLAFLEAVLRKALFRKTEGETKTRHLIGKRRQAKVTLADDAWEGSRLKEVWNAYPQYRDAYLKIGQIDVRLREFHKLKRAAGDDSFNCFRDMVVAANRGPVGLPRVTVTK